MRISVLCLGLNLVFTIALLFVFKPGYKQGALGVANSLSALANTALLVYALRRKLGQLDFDEFWSSLPALLGAGAVAGVVAWFGSTLWGQYLGHGSLWLEIGAVFGPAAAAALVYWALAWWLKVPSAREISALVAHRFRARR
jgi:peptidoglycan biosynthesis protein MviN/MurJ (putative lipid II flippase)